MSRTRIDARFEALKAANRAGFVTFLTAGDPDLETSLAMLKGLPGAGADIIELGMPFTDPMADGPAIQLSNQRALAGGAGVKDVALGNDAQRALLSSAPFPTDHQRAHVAPDQFLDGLQQRDLRVDRIDGASLDR